MFRGRLWRFITFFLFLYILFVIYSLHLFSSDNTDTTTTSPKPPVEVKGDDPVKVPNPVEPRQEENSARSLEPVMRSGILGNYEPKDAGKVSGPGENGEGVRLTDEKEKALGDKSVAEYGFNEVASEKISLNRHARDTRPDECKYWHYPTVDKLPTASVVLVFHDEGWSTLVRTFHSVINTSPKALLKDVILVDDFSVDRDITVRLPEYIKKWNGLVKYVRTKERVGLVEARVIGARAGEGDVIVILDAHCECVANWLPPLLTRIALNRKTLAVPIVDGIQWDTLQHNQAYGGSTLFRGIWEWGFLYKETEIPERERSQMKYRTEPYKSPTHAGGLLAIEKKWFFELGAYDPDIKIWVSCSHVGHIYRGPRTRSMHPHGANHFQSHINHLRVWMDDYKKYYLRRQPSHGHLEIGDTSAYKALRQRLNCSSFQWFMDNVAYEMKDKYPVPPENVVWGEMRNDQHSTSCADTLGKGFGSIIGVSGCHSQGGNQLFRLNAEGEWSMDERCYVSQGTSIVSRFCVNNGRWIPKGEWNYDNNTRQIRSNTVDKCVTTDGKTLFLETCQANNTAQTWKWKEIYLG
ncbi:unnamed protein product [Adineta ricciae]|uniref:Polypeptide N-acetylgalactosaminyltransferase n=1 Tax=Adineta ricciae TaxID=249248 RepID=A0A815U0V2_ADIRI|nr:unnamed protein product [Adineta ricciae]